MAASTWPDVLGSLIRGDDLDSDQTAWAMGEILSGEATPVQIAGFAVALRAKGETVEEVEGLVEAMYAHATPLPVPGRVLDVVGTGGDRSFSVNISTMAAIVAAGAGVTVVKHGNRSASSKSGSADVLEVLGIRMDLPASDVARVAHEAGITFCFAAAFHPALRHAAVARRELGRGHDVQLPRPDRQPRTSGGAGDRVRRPADGTGDGRSLRPARGRRVGLPWRRRSRRADHDHDVEPVDGQWGRGRRAHHRPGSAGHSAAEPSRTCAVRMRRTTPTSYDVCWPARPGPVRDAVLLNAGAALAVHAAEPGSVEECLATGLARATEAVDSGAAQATLERWVAATG